VQAKQPVNDIQFVAMFPQDKQQSEQYLKDNGIRIQDVRQSMPFTVGATGFPTLMLVDKYRYCTEGMDRKTTQRKRGGSFGTNG
jgi:hypothetical protein